LKNYNFYALTPEKKKIYKAGVGGLVSKKQDGKIYLDNLSKDLERNMKSDIKFFLDAIAGRNNYFVDASKKEDFRNYFNQLGLSDENLNKLTFHWEELVD
jgi:hypothetical protein